MQVVYDIQQTRVKGVKSALGLFVLNDNLVVPPPNSGTNRGWFLSNLTFLTDT